MKKIFTSFKTAVIFMSAALFAVMVLCSTSQDAMAQRRGPGLIRRRATVTPIQAPVTPAPARKVTPAETPAAAEAQTPAKTPAPAEAPTPAETPATAEAQTPAETPEKNSKAPKTPKKPASILEEKAVQAAEDSVEKEVQSLSRDVDSAANEAVEEVVKEVQQTVEPLKEASETPEEAENAETEEDTEAVKDTENTENTKDTENKESADTAPTLDAVEEEPAGEISILDDAEEKDVQNAAKEQVLSASENPEELAPVLEHAKEEDIHAAVKEAEKEVEADNQNTDINNVVEGALVEVDEEAIDKAVNEVLDSSDEAIKAEQKKEKETADALESEDALPAEVNQVLEEAQTSMEDDASAENDADTENNADTDAENDAEDAEDAENAENAAASEDSAEEELQEIPTPDYRMVKMADLDAVFQVPENASFEELEQFTKDMEHVRIADLDQKDAEVQQAQIDEFLKKMFVVRLEIAEKMLSMESLTDEQWETAVSLKVQSLATLFRYEESYLEEMRSFVDVVRSRGSEELIWKTEAVQIQMDLCSLKEAPTAEVLKEHVTRMLAQMKKGLDLDCLNDDFAVATVQMVLLTQEKLPKEEAKAIFTEAIEMLEGSGKPQFQEVSGILKGIIQRMELSEKPLVLTMTAHDGKTLNISDYKGRTLLLYCFSLKAQEQSQEFAFIYRAFMAYHDRGFDVVGICVDEKSEDMDEFLKQLPWPVVFEQPGKKTENSVLEALGITMAPVKILVGPDGMIKNTNVQPLVLLHELEKAYGPIEPEKKADADTSAADADSDANANAETPADAETGTDSDSDADADVEIPADADADVEIPADTDTDADTDIPAEMTDADEKDDAEDALDALETSLETPADDADANDADAEKNADAEKEANSEKDADGTEKNAEEDAGPELDLDLDLGLGDDDDDDDEGGSKKN